jgi:hypothetical protein
MFLTAKAFFQDNTQNNKRVLIRAETEIPAEFVKRFKKNVVKITPMKTGALRRSIITQSLGGRAEISWRSPYAKVQHEGGHTVSEPVRGLNPNTGKYSTIKPGFYRYRNYTTAGTGPRFGTRAYQATQAEMPAVLRELGLTK